MASIDLKGVSKIFAGGVPAVRDVNLSIADGEFMIFLGPSGCGKSTTLRMIAGLETVTAGDILIGGKRVNDVDPADRNIAIVFQNYALYPHMTVRDNLGFGLKLRHVPRAEIEKRIGDVSEMLGIGTLLARRPSQLSGGQRQRVALGRALVREPQAFLLDEPLSNLDAKLRASMRTELIKLHRRLGTTMVHVTHDQVEAMTMGERMCIMRDGEVVQVGAPLEVYQDPIDTFVASFLATPPMNLLPGRLETSDDRLIATALGFACEIPAPYRASFASYAGRDVIVGVRPEDLHASADRAGPLAYPLDALVETVEALGPETILTLSLPGSDIDVAARVDLSASVSIGQTIRLYFDARRIRLFDPATTRNIPRPE
jgi:multiple sugar transport system ATP-binding protein